MSSCFSDITRQRKRRNVEWRTFWPQPRRRLLLIYRGRDLYTHLESWDQTSRNRKRKPSCYLLPGMNSKFVSQFGKQTINKQRCLSSSFFFVVFVWLLTSRDLSNVVVEPRFLFCNGGGQQQSALNRPVRVSIWRRRFRLLPPPGGEDPAIFSVVYFRVSLSFIYIVSSQSGIRTLCACFFQRGQRQIKRVSCSFPWEKRQRGVAIWTQYEPWRHPLRLPEKASCVWRVFNWIPLLHLCRPLLLSVCKRASDALVSDSCRLNYLLTGRHNSGLGRRTVGTATTKIEGLCISVCYVGLLKNSRLHGNEIYFLHFAAGNNNIFLFLLSLMVFFFFEKNGKQDMQHLGWWRRPPRVPPQATRKGDRCKTTFSARRVRHTDGEQWPKKEEIYIRHVRGMTGPEAVSLSCTGCERRKWNMCCYIDKLVWSLGLPCSQWRRVQANANIHESNTVTTEWVSTLCVSICWLANGNGQINVDDLK